MSQILDSLPHGENDSILCCYVNATSAIQIARITNIPNWYFERVVFPGQRLVFEAISQALLEIHTGMMASAILSDTIPCTRLGIDQQTTAESRTSKVGVIAKIKQDVSIKNKNKFDVTSQRKKTTVEV